MENVRIKILQNLGFVVVWLVDGFHVRNEIMGGIEFTNFGHHQRFPFIPETEYWIDRYPDDPFEQELFVKHMIVESGLMRQGVPYEQANSTACSDETIQRLHNLRPGITKPYIERIDYPSEFEIYLVDGRYCRDIYDSNFSMGGNFRKFSWIPNQEIWIARDDQPEEERQYTILHETTECRDMKLGTSYDVAHTKASAVELEARRKFEKAVYPGNMGFAEMYQLVKNAPASITSKFIQSVNTGKLHDAIKILEDYHGIKFHPSVYGKKLAPSKKDPTKRRWQDAFNLVKAVRAKEKKPAKPGKNMKHVIIQKAYIQPYYRTVKGKHVRVEGHPRHIVTMVREAPDEYKGASEKETRSMNYKVRLRELVLEILRRPESSLMTQSEAVAIAKKEMKDVPKVEGVGYAGIQKVPDEEPYGRHTLDSIKKWEDINEGLKEYGIKWKPEQIGFLPTTSRFRVEIGGNLYYFRSFKDFKKKVIEPIKIGKDIDLTFWSAEKPGSYIGLQDLSNRERLESMGYEIKKVGEVYPLKKLQEAT